MYVTATKLETIKQKNMNDMEMDEQNGNFQRRKKGFSRLKREEKKRQEVFLLIENEEESLMLASLFL